VDAEIMIFYFLFTIDYWESKFKAKNLNPNYE